MDFEITLKEVQEHLSMLQFNGWLLYDYHHSNPFVHRFLKIPSDKTVSRRFFYWIPQIGDPIKIVPSIESYTLDHLPGLKWVYRSWQELERLIFLIAKKNFMIAMEYSLIMPCPAFQK